MELLMHRALEAEGIEEVEMVSRRCRTPAKSRTLDEIELLTGVRDFLVLID